MIARRSKLESNNALERAICRHVLNGLSDGDAHGGDDREGTLNFALDCVGMSNGDRPRDTEGDAVDLDRDERRVLETLLVVRSRGDWSAKYVTGPRAGEPPWLRD